MSPTRRWMGRGLTGLFVLFMAFDCGIKLVGIQEVAASMQELGWPASSGRFIGMLELLFTALYLYPRTAVLGAVLMTGILGGAVASHIRIASPLFSHILFGVYLGCVMWGGLYLREAGLRALFPWGRSRRHTGLT